MTPSREEGRGSELAGEGQTRIARLDSVAVPYCIDSAVLCTLISRARVQSPPALACTASPRPPLALNTYHRALPASRRTLSLFVRPTCRTRRAQGASARRLEERDRVGSRRER